MVKWQDINELAKEVFFFKKRSRSRTLWIRGGLLGSFASLLVYLSLLTGVTITTSGDIYGCGTDCNISINITSTYYRIGVESFPIYFDKELTYEIYVPTRGKDKWRLFVPGKDFIERKNKYHPLPNRFIVTIHKESWETVKYGVKMFGEHIDPYIYADNIQQIGNKIVKELCNPEYKDIIEKIQHYKEIKGQEFPNGTIIKDYQVLDYMEQNIIGTEQVDCRKIGIVNVSGVIYQGDDSWCKLFGDKVCCAHNKVGGQFASFWRIDVSVAMYCKDLITNKETWTNMIGKKRTDVIKLEK